MNFQIFLFRIFRFLASLKNLIYLNFIILVKKKINKNLRIIFFYFPVKSYQKNIFDLIDEIVKDKNIEVFLGYNSGTSKEVQDFKNSFFINLGYLKYLKKIDIFISSYVVYEFPKSFKKIYINHDIYDTPMVDSSKESHLFSSLRYYDYIFLSSDIAVNSIQKKLNFYLNDIQADKPKLINTGYLKLDHVNKILGKKKIFEDSILLAPTLSSMITDFNCNEYIETIIKDILQNTNYRLIYRPHPGDIRDNKKNMIIEKIFKKYQHNKLFELDINTSYLESYRKSFLLITDFSGTAYTFAFSKLRPLIFFSKNENLLKKSFYDELFFFKDRTEVGKIVQDLDSLIKDVHLMLDKLDIYSKKISDLRSKRIFYFKDSINQNVLNLKKILELK